MQLAAATGGLATTNGYLIIDDENKVAVAIDAPQGTMGVLLKRAADVGAKLELLLLTHGHWDHTSDHQVATNTFPLAKVWISRIEEERLLHPEGMTFELPYKIPPRAADAYIEDGQVIKVGGIELVAMHTPGHAAGHICFYWPAEKSLFAGDLLMAGTVGRWDLADGDLEQLQESLRKVLALPRETKVYSGHGPATTIGRELENNSFIRSAGLR